MTLTEMYEVVKNIKAGDDAMLKEVAGKVDELTHLLEAKDISESEYKELMADVEREQFIDAECKDLEGKAAIAQVFNWTKTAASFLL
jgi:hypothetical protein|tara:strand:+ start:365 stop:625 length:261 start_codon:yes stop_codon:yes gene_type:complete